MKKILIVAILLLAGVVMGSQKIKWEDSYRVGDQYFNFDSAHFRARCDGVYMDSIFDTLGAADSIYVCSLIGDFVDCNNLDVEAYYWGDYVVDSYRVVYNARIVEGYFSIGTPASANKCRVWVNMGDIEGGTLTRGVRLLVELITDEIIKDTCNDVVLGRYEAWSARPDSAGVCSIDLRKNICLSDTSLYYTAYVYYDRTRKKEICEFRVPDLDSLNLADQIE